MPSIKLLKKEINNEIGALIEDIYLWELSNPNSDLTKSEKLIEEAIQVFDDLIEKINAVSGDDLKGKFRAVNQERKKAMDSLFKKSAVL